MIPVRRLNHAVLFVSDVQRSVDFYQKLFGFSVVYFDKSASAAFLRAKDSLNHHDLGLFGLGPNAQRPRAGQIGLYHLAWEIDSIQDLTLAQQTLVQMNAFTGQSNHGATKSIYGQDPDGNQFEIMWMVPKDKWGAYESKPVVEPLDIATEINTWK